MRASEITGTSHWDVPSFLKLLIMKKEIIIIAIVVLLVVLLAVFMFIIYGLDEAKQIAPLINPAA